MSVTAEVRKRLTQLKTAAQSRGCTWLPVSSSASFEYDVRKLTLVYSIVGPEKKKLFVYMVCTGPHSFVIETLPGTDTSKYPEAQDLARIIFRDAELRQQLVEVFLRRNKKYN